MAFDTTVGGASANSYASVAEFDAYWALWTARAPSWIATATQAQKEANLMAAAMMLDALVTWTGVATTDTQALTWPRSGMLNKNGRQLSSSVNPNELKNAQCEYAGQLGDTDWLADDDAAKNSISSVQAGDVSVSFQRATLGTTTAADIAVRLASPEFAFMSKEIPSAVRNLLVKSWYSIPQIARPLVFKAY